MIGSYIVKLLPFFFPEEIVIQKINYNLTELLEYISFYNLQRRLNQIKKAI